MDTKLCGKKVPTDSKVTEIGDGSPSPKFLEGGGADTLADMSIKNVISFRPTSYHISIDEPDEDVEGLKLKLVLLDYFDSSREILTGSKNR